MATGFSPVGAALPPRRDMLITAADAPAPSGNDWEMSINVPMARDRMLEYFEREQLPGDVRSTLQAALNGDLHYQHMLFTAMIDTWPKLQKAIEEIARQVSVAPWEVHPYAERGEKPDTKAEKTAKDIEVMIWGMKPNAARMENGLEDTMKALVRGYYYGHAVCEIRWEKGKDGWKPSATKTVPARFYGYPYDAGNYTDPEDRLMFDPTGMHGSRAFEDFAPHRFLIGVHAGHAGHPATAAPLRALAGYWLAAVYGLKWFMNFTQLYGIPWRHAEVSDTKDEGAVKSALASIGSNGYIVTKAGTKINVLDSSKGGDSLPQKALIDLADQQCDQFILGQTLTSGTDDSGSRSLGEVHQGTLDGVVDGVADFVGGILTHQLIPAIVAVNYGGTLGDELPEFWAKREEVKDEQALADRDEKIGITSGKVKVSEAWFYERHGIPMPAAGDKLLIEEMEESQPVANGDPEGNPSNAAPNGVPGDPATPGKAPGHETKAKGGKSVEAADASQDQLLTVEQLSEAVLEGLTGVSREWLAPVRPYFERLAALAMSKHVTDEDFLAALEKAQRELPEIFDLLDSEALEEAFISAISSAAIAGSVSRYET